MAHFMIRFFISNVFISGIIGILLIAKQVFQKNLSSRMQYHLWFLFLGLLAVPFLPFRPIGFPQILLWLGILKRASSSATGNAMKETIDISQTQNADWITDFALSVSSNSAPISGYILLGIWVTGIFVMILFLIKSALCLRNLEKTALPLQNQEVRRLYGCCLKEAEITKDIPIYSTAFLKSPIIVGFLKPRIYLPIHLISDYNESDVRYMLLHELQHYLHKDALANVLMNLVGVIYWFHPLVWYCLKEMRNDREIACDSSVLQMLAEDSYADYGNTLINFAEKMSHMPFPFVSGIGGNMKQMKRRILNIASYEKPTFQKRRKGMAAFILTAVFLFGFSPMLSTSTAYASHYQWKSASENISCIDLSAYFGAYDGSFVLYDLENDAWSIHDMKHATLRVAPNSTYKVYDALFGLEESVVTPSNSFLAWNGETYPFDAWNADQTLQSAMHSSVNWYFQEMDEQLGKTKVSDYIHEIGYGNENINGDFSTYWMESSLKISAIEQVELLTKLHNNSFGFAPENINAIKDAICLSSYKTRTLYGKTGTGRVDGADVNGWFIGSIETVDHTYFFATNIKAADGATGNNAAKITMAILSDMEIWIQ